MGDHIIDGEFQSDKYPWTPRGCVPLKPSDPMAQDLLWEYAQRRREVDVGFADDLEEALRLKGFDPSSGSETVKQRYTKEERRAVVLELKALANGWDKDGTPPDSCGCTWAPVDVLRHASPSHRVCRLRIGMTRYDGSRFVADPYMSGRLDGLREALSIVRALRKSKSRDQAERKILKLIRDAYRGKE